MQGGPTWASGGGLELGHEGLGEVVVVGGIDGGELWSAWTGVTCVARKM